MSANELCWTEPQGLCCSLNNCRVGESAHNAVCKVARTLSYLFAFKLACFGDITGITRLLIHPSL